MYLRSVLLFFGAVHSFVLISKDLQSFINKILMPSDLEKMKMSGQNWRSEGIFEKITPSAGLFEHNETKEILFETKGKSWTGRKILDELKLYGNKIKSENLMKTKDWNQLFFLCWRWDQKDWREALAEVVDVNAVVKNGYGATALMRAVTMSGDSNVFEILLKRGADVNMKDQHGETALHKAVNYNRIKSIELLLKFNAEINATDYLSENSLMKAVRFSDIRDLNIDVVKVLLKYGADLTMKNDDEQTALDIAKDKRDYAGSHRVMLLEIIKILEMHQSK